MAAAAIHLSSRDRSIVEQFRTRDALVAGVLATGATAIAASATALAASTGAIPAVVPLVLGGISATGALFYGKGCQGAIRVFSEKFPQAARLSVIPLLPFPERSESGGWMGKGPSVTMAQVCDQKLARDMTEVFRSQGIGSVYDFGCGSHNGYVQEFVRNGLSATGIDVNFHVSPPHYTTTNLAEPTNLQKRDCVVSLEVLGKIDPKDEAQFLQNIVRTATKMVILSWPQPGQKGAYNDKNPRSLQYVIDEMGKLGWELDEATTRQLRDLDDPKVYYWLQDNLLVFVPKAKAD